MNERIKELAEQAKEYADTKYSKLVSASRWGDCVPGIRELYTEKLAELIVLHTIKDCRDMFVVSSVSWNLLDEKLKHFGVKE